MLLNTLPPCGYIAMKKLPVCVIYDRLRERHKTDVGNFEKIAGVGAPGIFVNQTSGFLFY